MPADGAHLKTMLEIVEIRPRHVRTSDLRAEVTALSRTRDDAVVASMAWLGTAGGGSAVVTLALLTRHQRRSEEASRRLYLLLLFGSAAVIAAAGIFGSVLNYGTEHLSW